MTSRWQAKRREKETTGQGESHRARPGQDRTGGWDGDGITLPVHSDGWWMDGCLSGKGNLNPASGWMELMEDGGVLIGGELCRRAQIIQHPWRGPLAKPRQR